MEHDRRYAILTATWTLVTVGCLALNALAESSENRDRIIDFESMNENALPMGFSIGLTGDGGPPSWIIQRQDDSKGASNAVVQNSFETRNYRFPLTIYDEILAKDIDLSVRFKPMSGRIDRAGGLVWRYQDSKNCYVVRANALENNVVLYKFENGKRSDLKPIGASLFAYGKDAPVPSGQWSTLRIVVRGDVFSEWLNDEHLFDVEDKTIHTAGRVGLWTKADSVTGFDDLKIIHLDPARQE